MNFSTYVHGFNFAIEMAENAKGVTWNRLFRAGLALKGLCLYPPDWKDGSGLNRDHLAPMHSVAQEGWPSGSVVGPIDA